MPRYRVEVIAQLDIAAAAVVVGGDETMAIAEALEELEARLRDLGFDTRSAPALLSSRVTAVRWIGRPIGPLKPCRACGRMIGFARVDGRAVPVDPDGAAHGSSCAPPSPLPGHQAA